LGARIANRTPGAEIDDELSANPVRRERWSTVTVRPARDVVRSGGNQSRIENHHGLCLAGLRIGHSIQQGRPCRKTWSSRPPSLPRRTREGLRRKENLSRQSEGPVRSYARVERVRTHFVCKSVRSQKDSHVWGSLIVPNGGCTERRKIGYVPASSQRFD